MEKSRKSALICKRCTFQIARHDQLCFLIDQSSGVHLSVKLEEEHSFFIGESIKLIDKKKEKSTNDVDSKSFGQVRDAICGSCGSCVGRTMISGPHSQEILFFRPKSSTFCIEGNLVSFSVKNWNQILPLMPEILSIDLASFDRSDFPSAAESAPSSELNSLAQVNNDKKIVVIPDDNFLAQLDPLSLSHLEPRPYQIECLVAASKRNTILYLPTGAGKTLVAAMLIKLIHLLNYSNQKIVIFVVDRVPLAYQQASFIQSQTGLKTLVVCGDNSDQVPWQRVKRYPVLVLTAQVLHNLLARNWISFEDVSLLVIDEVHHAKKNHPYQVILGNYYAPMIQKYRKETEDAILMSGSKVRDCCLNNGPMPLILGLSATPVQGLDSIDMKNSLENLCTLAGNAHVYTPFVYREDLLSAVKRPTMQLESYELASNDFEMSIAIDTFCLGIMKIINGKIGVETDFKFSTFNRVHSSKPLNYCISSRMGEYRGYLRYLTEVANRLNDEEVLSLILYLHRVYAAFEVNSVVGCAHARNLLIKILDDDASGFVSSPREFVLLQRLSSDLRRKICAIENTMSSKFKILIKILLEKIAGIPDDDGVSVEKFKFLHRDFNSEDRTIVFVQTRHTAYLLVKLIEEQIDLKKFFRPAVFVGHASGNADGMSWEDEQYKTLDSFRSGNHNLIIATDVLQEGIDVPVCNNVILFDQTSMSLISFVQSRGRARADDSRYFLICEGKDRGRFEHLVLGEKRMESIILTRILRDRSLNHTCPHHNASLSLGSIALVNKVKSCHWRGKTSDLKPLKENPSLHDLEELVISISNVDLLNFDRNLKLCTKNDAIQILINLICEVMMLKDVSSECTSDIIFPQATMGIVSIKGRPCHITSFEDLYMHLLPMIVERLHSYQAFLSITALQCANPFSKKSLPSVSLYTHNKPHTSFFEGTGIEIGSLTSPKLFNSIKTSHMYTRLIVDVVNQSIQLIFALDSHSNDSHGETNSGKIYYRIDFSFTSVIGDFIIVDPTLLRNFKPDSSGYQGGGRSHNFEINDNPSYSSDFKPNSNGFIQVYLSIRTAPLIYFSKPTSSREKLDIRLTPVELFSWERASASQLCSILELQGCTVFKLELINNSGLTLQRLDSAISLGTNIRILYGKVGKLCIEKSKCLVSPSLIEKECLRLSKFDEKYSLQVLANNLEKSIMYRMPVSIIQRLVDYAIEYGASIITDFSIVMADWNLGYFIDFSKIFDYFCEQKSMKKIGLACLSSEVETVSLIENNSDGKFVCEEITDSNKNGVFVRSLVITPTRIIYYHSRKMAGNRLLRFFDSESFLRVHFRDENLGKISHSKSTKASLDSIYARIKIILKDGFWVGGRRFELLACSSSQLREHGCWFFASCQHKLHGTVDVAFIRNWIGHFDKFRSVAKYMARLGQGFSASIDVGELEESETQMISDYKIEKFDSNGTPVGEYIFSDGVGMISPAICRQISEFLGYKSFDNDGIAGIGKKSMPSAFQIRYGGCKGVVALNPNVVLHSQDRVMWIRPSMKKFDSPQRSLEIINVAEYIPAFLNRQIIMILSSLGVPDSSFINLQDRMLQDLSDNLLDDEKAALTLENLINNPLMAFDINFLRFLDVKHSRNPSRIHNSDCFNSSIDETDQDFSVSKLYWSLQIEPFFRSLLLADYKRKMNDLLTRSRIFCPKARILMGIIDETGTLAENEVFVRVTPQPSDAGDDLFDKAKTYKTENWFNTIVSSVVIAKNPCMHPGDIRVMKAVNNDWLQKYHHDVIVFPRTGNRPITDMCSGSDLDGDLYFVSWDPALIPPIVTNPMDYTSTDKPKILSPDVPRINTDHIVDFILEFIKNDDLGPLANLHVALSDFLPQGVRDPLCINLARLFSHAVDFAKTGFIPKIPANAHVEKWPDFMQKSDQPSYISHKVIGRMFRRIKSINFPETLRFQYSLGRDESEEFNLNQTLGLHHSIDISNSCTIPNQYYSKVDRLFLYPGYEQYLNWAHELYLAYCRSLASMLLLYGFKCEGQIFSGAIFDIANQIGKDDSMQYARTISDAIKRLRASNISILHTMSMESKEECPPLHTHATTNHHIEIQIINNYLVPYIKTGSQPNEKVKKATGKVAEIIMRRVSACYYIAYSQTVNHGLSEPIYSFPWMFSEYLFQIRRFNSFSFHSDSKYTESQLFLGNSGALSNIQTPAIIIGAQASKGILKYVLPDLKATFIDILRFYNEIQELLSVQVQSDLLSLELVGSAASLLFFPEVSDVNMELHVTKCAENSYKNIEEKIRLFLENLSIFFSKEQISCHHVVVGASSGDFIGLSIIGEGKKCAYPFTITIKDSNSVNSAEFNYVLEAILEDSINAVVIFSMVRWARMQNLIRKSRNGDGHKMSATHFAYLISKFLSKFSSFEEKSESKKLNQESQFNIKNDMYSSSNMPIVITHLQSSITNFSISQVSAVGNRLLLLLQHFALTPYDQNDDDEDEDDTSYKNFQHFREYMFQAFHILVQTLNIEALWNTVHTAGADSDISLSVISRMDRRRKSKPSLLEKSNGIGATFVEGASEIFFSKSKSAFDIIDFRIYHNPFRSSLRSTLSYRPVLKLLNHDSKLTDENFIYTQFYTHAHRQFDLIRRVGSAKVHGECLQFSMKVGFLYLSHLPRLFLEDQSAANISTLRQALAMSYQAIGDLRSERFSNPKIEAIQRGVHPIDYIGFPLEHDLNPAKDLRASRSVSELIDDNEDIDKRFKSMDCSKNQKMRKSRLSPTRSSFEPCITNDTRILSFLEKHQFLFNLDNSEASEIEGQKLVVYFSLYSKASGSNIQCSASYKGSEFKFDHMATKFLRWLHCDFIEPESSNENLKVDYAGNSLTRVDSRIMISTRNILDLDKCVTLNRCESLEANTNLSDSSSPTANQDENLNLSHDLISIIKDGVVKFGNHELTEKIVPSVVSAFKSQESIFVRLKNTKNYRLCSEEAAIELQRSFPAYLADIPVQILTLITIELNEVIEYSKHDPETGFFSDYSTKKEVSIIFNVPWDNFQSDSDHQSFANIIVPSIWNLSHFLRSIV